MIIFCDKAIKVRDIGVPTMNDGDFASFNIALASAYYYYSVKGCPNATVIFSGGTMRVESFKPRGIAVSKKWRQDDGDRKHFQENPPPSRSGKRLVHKSRINELRTTITGDCLLLHVFTQKEEHL